MIVQCTRCAYQAIRRMSDTWARSSGNHHTPGRDATRAAPGEGETELKYTERQTNVQMTNRCWMVVNACITAVLDGEQEARRRGLPQHVFVTEIKDVQQQIARALAAPVAQDEVK